MNERIRQLAEQAGATVVTTHGMEHVVDGCYVIGPARLEKFAELIIDQCVRACVEDIADPRDTIELQCAQKIKRKFGVE